ncbi:MAG: DUF3761 domain-containing protein [Patescibacteria group bacterium]|jgi:hypothetical protein
MKLRYFGLLFSVFLLTACTEASLPQSQVPAEQKQVAPVEERVEVKDKIVAPEKVEVKKKVEGVKVETKKEIPAEVPLSNDNTYINSAGNEVHSPAFAPSIPAGASAKCRDGSYSFSQSRRGTCSHHGGVAEWY